MKEIKFRLWDKSSEKMRQVVEIVFNAGFETEPNDNNIKFVWAKGREEINGDDIQIKIEDKNRYILMQYTGLHDKNGKEIYEGDVVKLDNDVASVFNIKSTGKVEYNNGLFLVRNGDEIGILSSLFVLADTKYCLRGEVIGNIYDTPELLKGGEKNED